MSILLDGTLGITTPGLTNTGTETIVNLTTTGNTILGDASTDTLNVGNGGLVKDASGNVGIGTASPSNKLSLKTTSGGCWLQTEDSVNTSGGNVNLFGSLGTGVAAVYTGGANPIAFYTNATERMRIDTSGNVGVGVTPSAWGSPLAHAIELAQGTGITAHSGSATSYYTSNAYYNGSNWIYKSSVKATLMTMSGSDGSFGWNTAPSGTAGNAITFTQAMTLDASGKLGVGTAPTYTGHFVNTTDAASASFGIMAQAATVTNQYGLYIGLAGDPNNTTNYFFSFLGSSTTRAVLRANGGLANYSANNVNLSDERVKKDIVNAGSYLDKICAIPVRTFLYKDQTDTQLNLGVIAQEVEVVAPELVDVSGFGETPEDGIPLKAIYQTDLQYALMKCIQEQQALITSLTARLEVLEAK